MKKLLLMIAAVALLISCNNKTELAPQLTDTLIVAPPAALDTMSIQQRPADSLLKTRR